MSFDTWKSKFLDHALTQGVSQPTCDRIKELLVDLHEPKAADAAQPEARKTLKQYLTRTVSDSRIENGKNALARYARVFDQIENTYGVEREIVAAIWGMETNYGQIRGDILVFAALATLANQGRRKTLFENQLIAACKMVQDDGVDPTVMIGSWAGAMGHTQFMPTSYRDFATGLETSFADIWSDDPSDALASTAHYLKSHGWIKGVDYAVECSWPADLDLAAARHRESTLLADWAAIDVRPCRILDYDAAFRFHLPAGAHNPALLVSNNYAALLAYNNADAYAVAVGHLAHRLAGGQDFITPWHGDEAGLTLAEAKDAQERLTAMGYDTQGADGFPGANTRVAIEAFQTAQGIPVDGHLDQSLLGLLRRLP